MELRPEILGVAESPMVVIATIAESMPGSLKLCYGESDLPTPAFICDALDVAARHGHTFYTHTAGCTELRETIAASIERLHGVRYDVSEIMATVGGSMAIFATVRAFIGAGDNAVIVSPAYAIYANSIRLCGGEPRFAPLAFGSGRFTLDLDRVARAIDPQTRMLIINSPSNPTGWVITPEEQRALIALAERHNLVILADEVYERLVYSGAPVAPSFASLVANRDRLVVVNSFSKTYNMTGWRLGWAQSSTRIIRALYKAIEFMTSNPTAMVQQAGIAALREGDAHVESLRAHYHRQRDRVAQALQSIDGVTLAEPHGSFFAFAQVDGITDTAAFTEALVRETGLALAPGAGFGDDGEGFVRICFASSDAVVADAMHRLTHYIRQRRG